MSTKKTLSQIQIATQKVTEEAEYKALINGIVTELAGVDPIVLVGTSYPRATLLAEFQKRVDAAEATRSARGTLQTAVSAESAVREEVKPLRAAMKQYVQSRYGQSSPTLQTFGFTQAKVRSIDSATKAGAAVKTKATRAARGIMGKKQRAAIKAPAAGSTVVAAPAAPIAPVAAPAASAPAVAVPVQAPKGS